MKYLALSLCLLNLLSCHRETTGIESEPETFAVVNGVDVPSREILDKVKGDLEELQRNAYEIKRRATEEVVQKRLIEEEAKKQGTTVDRLMSQFDDLSKTEPTPQEFAAFFKKRGLDEKKITRDERQMVPQMIRMGRVYEARKKFLDDLRAKANVRIKIPRPADRLAKVNGDDDPSMGDPKAPVELIAFIDYQDMPSAQAFSRFRNLVDQYKGKLKIVWRDFPAEAVHPLAFRAAEAAGCALEQNKFWEMSQSLFSNQSKIDTKNLEIQAERLGLNSIEFKKCLETNRRGPEIRHDIEDGTRAGVDGLPAIFINGRAMRGLPTDETLVEVIDLELSKR